MSASRPNPRALSRRNVLGLALGTGAALPLAAACGRAEPPATNQPSGQNPSSQSSVPNAGELSGSLTVAIPLATGADKKFYSETFQQFSEQTGVDVTLLDFPDAQYAESIQGLFRGGDEPDVYRMVKPPATMKASWTNDWIQPLDDYPVLTDLLKDQYGDTALEPASSGLHIDGKLYGVPGPRSLGWDGYFPLMVNQDLLSKYGIAEPPKTWSELRDAAKKVSVDSGGDAFGFAPIGNGNLLPNLTLNPLIATAGPVRALAALLPFDATTGKAAAGHPSAVQAVELLRGMVTDESVVPGWQNLAAQGFWQAWSAGKIAMAVIAPWWSEEILKINPDVNVTVVAVPVPDSGRGGYASYASSWAPQWGLTAASENPEAAAALMAHLGSLDVQRAYYQASKVPTALADKYLDDLTDNARSIIELAAENKRQKPMATVRNEKADDVVSAVQAKAPKPGWKEIVFAAIDKGEDYAAQASAFDEQLDGVIAAAIAEVGVDEHILTFPDWDPLQDYTTEPGE